MNATSTIRTHRIFGLVAACLLALLLTGGTQPKTSLAQTSERPNIILILTDDMTLQDAAHMPRLRQMMMNQGTTFNNAFVSKATCCPSRATILRGQYMHNHQVLKNAAPEGGFEKFYQLGHESSTIATWLQSGGYRTALIGKYLNGYPAANDPTYVPLGWDEWYAAPGQGAFNYKLIENGESVTYGSDPADYKTDVLARKATDYVSRAEGNDEQPFFMYLAPTAPHNPATSAPRHEDSFPGVTAPRPPSFDEADVSDKPEFVSSRRRLTSEKIAEIEALYGNRLRSLLAVDDMIENVVNTLGDNGELDNTYIVFTSDNGFHLGEHRLPPGKGTAYEEDIRVPLIVRGPGVPADGVSERMTLNTDFAPTFAQLGGVEAPSFLDGRSLVPLLGTNPPGAANWRSAILVESATDDTGIRPIPAFQAVRTQKHLYVEYESGERELYDLAEDPYELDNLYASADPDLIIQLQARLGALRGCVGAKCRSAEDEVVDTVAPETTIARLPLNARRSSSVSLTFSSSEPGSTFECRLDGAAFDDCSSPREYAGLADGAHTFRVRATDAAGNTDPTPATRHWSTDTVAPSGMVIINDGDETTSSQTVTLTLSASDPDPGFGVSKMRFKNRGFSWSAWEPYATTETWELSAGAGKKTVNAQYKDGVGNISATASDTISYTP